MKKVWILGVILIVPIFSWAEEKALVDTAEFFKPVENIINDKSTVPPALPNWLPDYLLTSGEDDETAPQPTLSLLEDNGYEIVLGFGNCRGGAACRIGTLTGKRYSQSVTELEGEEVILDKTRTGYFQESECGANCSDATIIWKQGDFVYSMGLKAAELKEVKKMVLSAFQDPR